MLLSMVYRVTSGTKYRAAQEVECINMTQYTSDVVLDIINRANEFEGIIRDIADEIEEELNEVCLLISTSIRKHSRDIYFLLFYSNWTLHTTPIQLVSVLFNVVLCCPYSSLKFLYLFVNFFLKFMTTKHTV